MAIIKTVTPATTRWQDGELWIETRDGGKTFDTCHVFGPACDGDCWRGYTREQIERTTALRTRALADTAESAKPARPEWVRIIKSATPSMVKNGDVRRVVMWNGDDPSVEAAGWRRGYLLDVTTWEPCEAPKPAPYVPKVGDVVFHEREPGTPCVVTSVESDGDSVRGMCWTTRDGYKVGFGGECWRYLRPATPEERVAAGIDPCPTCHKKGGAA